MQISNNSNFVATVSVLLDQNSAGDQTISFSDGSFNNAVSTFIDAFGNPIPLAEVIDNVTFQKTPDPVSLPQPIPEPIPEPSSVLGLLTFTAFGIVAMLKRKRRKYQSK